MTEYTLTLKIPNAGNKQIYCSVHLTGSDINYPEVLKDMEDWLEQHLIN